MTVWIRLLYENLAAEIALFIMFLVKFLLCVLRKHKKDSFKSHFAISMSFLAS